MSAAGTLFVFSGPSGAGKSTVIKRLRERLADLKYSISHTTRKPREGEVNGVHYYFVTRAAFEDMIARGDFAEWAAVYDHLYGTSFSGIDRQLASGEDILLDIDVQGAGNIRGHYQNSVLIFILPPSLEALERRLKDRGTDSADVVRKRMATARKEIGRCRGYDYVIVNEDLAAAVDEARAVLLSDRCRLPRRMASLRERFPGLFAGMHRPV